MDADSIAEAIRPRRRRRRIRRAVRFGVGLVLLTLLVLLATPLLDRSVPGHPEPADSYATALVLADRLRAADGPEVNPLCRSRVLEQGRRTRVAVVLLHGYTNCPQQWDRIASAYAASGVSVVVPRLPGHGYADRLTRALGDLTPEALAAVADQAVDIAAGLGEEVHVVGSSAGGALATWLATRRDEVDQLTLISPLGRAAAGAGVPGRAADPRRTPGAGRLRLVGQRAARAAGDPAVRVPRVLHPRAGRVPGGGPGGRRTRPGPPAQSADPGAQRERSPR